VAWIMRCPLHQVPIARQEAGGFRARRVPPGAARPGGAKKRQRSGSEPTRGAPVEATHTQQPSHLTSRGLVASIDQLYSQLQFKKVCTNDRHSLEKMKENEGKIHKDNKPNIYRKTGMGCALRHLQGPRKQRLASAKTAILSR
jgi:hypothetical protein